VRVGCVALSQRPEAPPSSAPRHAPVIPQHAPGFCWQNADPRFAPPDVDVPVPWAVAVPPPLLADVVAALVVVFAVVPVEPLVVVLADVLVLVAVDPPPVGAPPLLALGLVAAPGGTTNAGAPEVSVEFEVPPPQAARISGAARSAHSEKAAALRRTPLTTGEGIVRVRWWPAVPSAGRTSGSR
jgi:hypothetical protein